MANLSDKTPSLDIYYCFRRRLVEYEDAKGVNLMDTCFKDVTAEQIKMFDIAGKSVRMDSKHIGSNIAWYSRYRLILTTLQHWAENGIASLNPSLRKKLEAIVKEDGQQTEYHSDSETVYKRLISLGKLIYQILVRIKAGESLLLKRFFDEQFLVDKGVVTRKQSAQRVCRTLMPPMHITEVMVSKR